MAEGWNVRVNWRFPERTHYSSSRNNSRRNSEFSSNWSRSDRSLSRERMSTTGSMRVPCRYFQRGVCTYGDQCRFLHSSSSEHHAPFMRKGNTNGRGNGYHVTSDTPTTSSFSGTTSNGSICRQDNRKNSSLRKQETSSDSGIGDEVTENWVNAPEFIPSALGNANVPPDSCASSTNEVTPESNDTDTSPVSGTAKPPKSYAEVVNPGTNTDGTTNSQGSDKKFCPYMEHSGRCEYDSECPYIHGDMCEFCGKTCLHPEDEEQRKQHHNECIKQHELDMELSFAVARSKDKVCGVCMEVVMEKSPGEQRFGILPNCNHCFCLACIRKWRQAKQFDNKIIRACPECRVTSDFVCPSVYWVDTKEEKEKLIQEYKVAMSVKNCKYFNSGIGKCPFGNKCFYLHAYPDGTKADVGPPPRQRRHNADGELEVLQQIILWDYLEERDNRLMIDELEDFFEDFFSDSDDSDWSEFDFFFG